MSEDERITHQDFKYLTYTTAYAAVLRAKSDMMIETTVGGLSYIYAKMYVEAVKLLCTLYIQEQTPHVFDDSIVELFKDVYEDEACSSIIQADIASSTILEDNIWNKMKSVASIE